MGEPTGIYGIIAGTVGLLNATRGLVNELRKWCKDYKEVRKKCDELSTGLNKLDNTMKELEKYDEQCMTPIRKRQVEDIVKYLVSAGDLLQKERNNFENQWRLTKLVRTRKVLEMIDDLIEKLDRMDLRGLVIDVRAGNLQASTVVMKDGAYKAQYSVLLNPGGTRVEYGRC